MKITMITKKPHIYAGKRLALGNEFEVAGRDDARLLEALGRAERKPKIVAPSAPIPTYYRPIITVPRTVEVAAESDGKPKRQYKRRDMTAES